MKIFVAAAANATFEGATGREQKFNPGLANTTERYVLGSGTTLYFGGSTGTTNWEIDRTTGWGTDASAPIVRLAELSSPGNDQAPVVTEDEREIFFSSDRAGGGTGLDMYRARKTAGDPSFGAVEPLAGLSRGGNDWPVWISPDDCDLYFINKDPVTTVATLRVASRR